MQFLDLIRFDISILLLFLISLLLKGPGGIIVFLIYLFSIVLHEASHLWAARISNIKTPDIPINIHIFGGYTEFSENIDLKPKEGLLIAIAGPISNLFLALIFCIVDLYFKSPFITLALQMNLLLGVVNLMPLTPLDGWRALRSYLLLRFPTQRALVNHLSFKIGLASGFLFVTISALLGNSSLCLMCVYLLVMHLLAGDINDRVNVPDKEQ